MIKQKILGFVLTILAISGLNAQTPPLAQSDEPVVSDKRAADNLTSDTLANALLWEVSGDSIQTSYVFGTIHMIPAEDYFLPVGTEEAIARTQTMMFEIDMKEMMDISAQMGLLMKAFMPEGKKLSDLISEEDYAIVKAHFDDLGLPLMILERLKPMFLSVFASTDFSMDEMQNGSTKSYEMEFFEMSQE